VSVLTITAVLRSYQGVRTNYDCCPQRVLSQDINGFFPMISVFLSAYLNCGVLHVFQANAKPLSARGSTHVRQPAETITPANTQVSETSLKYMFS
jgi:hypothetical protein